MVFEDLNGLNINGHTEKKKVEGKELTYLSWPWAWAEVKKRYPDAHYSIWKNENGLPYTEDPATGYMVYTSVTIEGVTHEMWLPVMNGANKAMKRAPYKYTTKYGEKSVEAATMMDINKTIMRCLVKNLAMFGLGLYIYAGEDLPEAEKEDQDTNIPDRPTNAPRPAPQASTSDRVPPAQPAPQTPQPAPPKTMSEGAAYLAAEKKKLEQEIGGNFNFGKARLQLIADGKVESIPSATITLPQAQTLIKIMRETYGKQAG